MNRLKAGVFGVLMLAVLLSFGGTAGHAARYPPAPAAGPATVLTPEDFEYNPIDIPGATRTAVFGVNAQETIVGRCMIGGVWHGFKLQDGSVTDIVYPGASMTTAFGINSRGDIAGSATVAGKSRGFLLADGEFTDIIIDGAIDVYVYAINDSGMVLGRTGTYANFLWRAGSYEILALPPVAWAEGLGLNTRGEVAGHFVQADDATNHMIGFVFWKGSFSAVDYPTPNAMACFQGIGDTGDAVGHVQLGSVVYGTMWKKGRVLAATLRYPGAAGTYPRNITPGGTIYGYYLVGGIPHGFVARRIK
jgi:hypothetical protein